MELAIFLAAAFVLAIMAALVLLYLSDDASQLQYPEWHPVCPDPDDLPEIAMLHPEEREAFNKFIDREYYTVHGGG